MNFRPTEAQAGVIVNAIPELVDILANPPQSTNSIAVRNQAKAAVAIAERCELAFGLSAPTVSGYRACIYSGWPPPIVDTFNHLHSIFIKFVKQMGWAQIVLKHLPAELPLPLPQPNNAMLSELRETAARLRDEIKSMMLAWLKDAASTTTAAADSPTVSVQQQAGKPRRSSSNEPRSMKQSEVDALIVGLISQNKRRISDLADAVRRGKPGADRDAKKTFGCKAVTRAIGCKNHSAVSKSEEWRRLATRLGLDNKAASPKKTGLGIAMDAPELAVNDQGIEDADKADTIKFIRAQLPAKEAKALIKKLNDGSINDEDATEIAKLGKGQQIDRHSRKAL